MTQTEHLPAVVHDAPAVAWTPSFAVAVDEAIERKREKRRFFLEVMEEGLHYGKIPGTGEKPTLLKPGAEMLLSNMGLNATFVDAEPPTIDVLGTEHNGEAYIRYRRICRIYRQLGPSEDERMIVAEAAGSCSSWETKYRYRNDKLRCPECGNPSIIKAKDFSGEGRDLGWVCWKKGDKERKESCGAKFEPGDSRIAGQSVGKILNPDVAELENTILKMADKRALVAATLIATGCSDIFTQDVEDGYDETDVRPTENLQDGKGSTVTRPSGGSSPGLGASRDAQTPPAKHVAVPEQEAGLDNTPAAPGGGDKAQQPSRKITPQQRAEINAMRDRFSDQKRADMLRACNLEKIDKDTSAQAAGDLIALMKAALKAQDAEEDELPL